MRERDIGIGIIGTGQRGCNFARFLADGAEGGRLVALCDRDEARMRSVAQMVGGDEVILDTDHRKVLDLPQVDAVVVATPDHTHEEVALGVMDAGKHLFLEKPMATTLEGCARLARRAVGYKPVLQLGYVLRYAPFYEKLYELLHSGVLGQIILMEFKEIVGYRHGASYVRRWHRLREKSGGLILTKCCHDLDILNWLSGQKAVKVASFGGLSFFKRKPELPAYCSECSADCAWRFHPQDAFILITPEEREGLEERKVDLCVFNADKDIVDNQVAIIEYEGEVRASFSVTLFGPRETRCVFISGTEGQVIGEFATGEIRLRRRGSQEEEVMEVESYGGGHAGADRNTWQDFINHVLNGTKPSAGAEEGFESALVALGAEMSREEGKVVDVAKLRQDSLRG